MGLERRKPNSRRTLLWVVLTALALHLPTISWGFFLDDQAQQMVFAGEPVSPTMSRANVFDFGYAPQPGEALFESGAYPWWTSPDWKARFFRPLTSLSLALDQALFGRRAWLHHLTSLGLYTLVLLVAHRLYRRAGLGGPALLLAVLILGCEDGSALVVGWLANRHTLLEALFGALAIHAALPATASSKGSANPWLAVTCAVLATLSKESGITALGVVALMLWRPHRPAATAAALLAGAHLAFLFTADFGARAVFYPSPWLPGGLAPWLENLAFTLTVQPLAAVSPFPVDLVAFEPAARRASLLIGSVLTPLICFAVWRRARHLSGAGWLALWGWVNLLPQSLAPASDRLAFVPTLCFAPLVATYLWDVLTAPAAASPGKLTKVPAGLLALSALPLSALMLGVRSTVTGPIMEIMESVVLGAELAPLEGSADEGRRDVLVLQYPNATAGFGASSTWAFETGDRRTRLFSLQFSSRGLQWTRIDSRRMDFTSLNAPFATSSFESVFVGSALPPEVGQRWRTAAFEVEAREVDEAGLRTIRVTWHQPMTDGDPLILTWSEDRLGQHPLPPIGEPLTLLPATPRLDFVP